MPQCPWTQVSHRPGPSLSGGRGADQVDDLAGALPTGRAGSGAPGGGAGEPDLEDLGGCGKIGPVRGGGLGVHGVGGDHGPVQVEGLDRLGQGGDLVGPVRHLALGQDRSGGAAQGRQQVRGGLVAATGAAHGPAVHRDEPAFLDCQGQPQRPPPSPRTTLHPRKHTETPTPPETLPTPCGEGPGRTHDGAWVPELPGGSSSPMGPTPPPTVSARSLPAGTPGAAGRS